MHWLGNRHVTSRSSICQNGPPTASSTILSEVGWAYVCVTVLWDPLNIQCLLLGVISGWNVNVVWDEKEGSLHTVWCFPRCVPCTLDSRHAFVAATWTWKAFFHKRVLLLLCSCSLLPGTWQKCCQLLFWFPSDAICYQGKSQMEKWMWETQISTTGSWSNATPFYL